MVRQNTVARIESRKKAGSLPLIYYVMHVFDFLFENLPLNKMYNVFSSCYSMYSCTFVSTVLILTLTICFVFQSSRYPIRIHLILISILHQSVPSTHYEVLNGIPEHEFVR